MKPGNRLLQHGANSIRAGWNALEDKKRYGDSASSLKGFFIWKNEKGDGKYGTK
jgi:hypothetical protein